MHLHQTGSSHLFLLPPPRHSLEVVILKSSPFSLHLAVCARAHFKRFTLILQSLMSKVSSSFSPLMSSFSSHLYSLDLVGHHHGVLFADLGGGFGLVIIGAVVLVGVPVDTTEQVATATVEPWKHRSQRVSDTVKK